MEQSMVGCEVAHGPRCAISTTSKDGHRNFTRTASSSKYNSDKSRIAVPVKPCVQRQFQVFLFGLLSAVCSDLVVLHRYRCHVTTDMLGSPANGENTATTGNTNGSTALDDRLKAAGPAGTPANDDRCGQSSRRFSCTMCPGSQRKSG